MVVVRRWLLGRGKGVVMGAGWSERRWAYFSWPLVFGGRLAVVMVERRHVSKKKNKRKLFDR